MEPYCQARVCTPKCVSARSRGPQKPYPPTPTCPPNKFFGRRGLRLIIRRKAGIMEFTDEFVQSPSVQEMMDRVEAVIDPEIDALGRDKIVSVIEIQLKDGRILRGKPRPRVKTRGIGALRN